MGRVLGSFGLLVLYCVKLEKTQTLKIPHYRYRKGCRALATISNTVVSTLAVLTLESPGDLKILIKAVIWTSASKDSNFKSSKVYYYLSRAQF